MQTFLGQRTGEKILDEQVKRGDGEDIHAVILFCDLRNSMPILDRMERNAFLRYLNQFFDCIAVAVSDHGGEVPRVDGDAVFAILPIDGEEGTAAAAAARAGGAATTAPSASSRSTPTAAARAEGPFATG